MENNIQTTLTPTIETQYIISVKKFIFLSLITFGLYSIWWYYNAWRFFNQKENSNIHPAIRTILGIFFFIPLTSRIFNLAKSKSYQHNFSPTLLFVAYLFTVLLSYLPFPFGLISVFSFIFLIQPFKALNFAKLNSRGYTVIAQNSFNGRQFFLIFIGSLWWLVILLSLYAMMNTEPEYPNYY